MGRTISIHDFTQGIGLPASALGFVLAAGWAASFRPKGPEQPSPRLSNAMPWEMNHR